MAKTQWARRFSALAALMAWLGLGLAAPIVMSLYSSDMAGDAVEAAPGDALTVVEPVVISTTPYVKVERGTIAVVDQNGRPASHVPGGADGGAPSIAPGHVVRIYNAVVTVAGSGPMATTAATFRAPAIEALAAGRYEVLSLLRTTVVIDLLGDKPETITDVKADIAFRRRGLTTVKGTGQVRGQAVTLDLTAGTGLIERKSGGLARMPVKLAVKGSLVDLSFDGRMSMGVDGVGLLGPGEMTVPSIRRVARWFGAYWSVGAGLRDGTIRGQMSLSRSALSFENASVRLDGNEAAGVVALRVGGPRPVITGTLAYKAFDAKPYLQDDPSEREALTWSSLAGHALTVPLGMHLDADLRISADKVVLGGVELGRSAATIALKDGRLLADLAEMTFNGGEGGGQITADFNGHLPRVTVRGKLDKVDAAALSTALIGRPLLQGPANVVVDLAGSASTLQGVLQGMTGKLAIKLFQGSKLGLDLRALVTAARSRELHGWDAGAKGATTFDDIDLRLVLRDGTLLTENAEARAGDEVWSAVGVVNLLSDRIDLRLIQATGTTAAKSRPQTSLEVHGPLRGPSIKPGNEAERSLPR